MSLISYVELLHLVESGVIDADPANINGTSIDITLGNQIMVERRGPIVGNVVDLKEKQQLQMGPVRIPENGWLLLPGEFILATTQETFNLPDYISAEYKLKSSLARSGLQHLLAGWCDPGWTNSKLTLELINVTRHHTLRIKTGMKIGQMVFWKCNPVPQDKSYSVTGQYNNQTTVTANKGVK